MAARFQLARWRAGRLKGLKRVALEPTRFSGFMA